MSSWLTKRRALAFAGISVVFAAAAIGWALFGGMGGNAESSIDPTDPEFVALGQQVYAANCASCHGASLQGQADWRKRRPDSRLPAPPHDATGHTWHHDDATLFTVTKYGLAAIAGAGYRSDMPAYEATLSDHQIQAVLAYIRSMWPAEIRARQAQITRQARGQN